jgi:hypothetical protein
MWLFVWVCVGWRTCELISRLYKRLSRRRYKLHIPVNDGPTPELVCIKVDMMTSKGESLDRRVIIRNIHTVTVFGYRLDWINRRGETHHTYGKILKTWTSVEDLKKYADSAAAVSDPS